MSMTMELERGNDIYSLEVNYFEEPDTNACELEIVEVWLNGVEIESIELTNEERAALIQRASDRIGDDDEFERYE